MNGETDLTKILKTLKPRQVTGDYVFCIAQDLTKLNFNDIVFFFREEEGITVVVKKEVADQLMLRYTFVAAWITLTVHSSLESVGLTAAFSKALSENGISCNVVAAVNHDHIFVPKKDGKTALEVLTKLSNTSGK
ncbi:MAG TPA: ACT domain-containing protein [Chryseolinea sp.]